MFNQDRIDIIRSCPIKVFSASAPSVRYWYPYRLAPVSSAESQAAQNCLELMVDSDIGNQDVANGDVIQAAIETNATYVVPKDYLHNVDQTSESINEFVDQYRDSRCPATPVIPLQPPHDVHYRCHPDFSHYMVGGVKDEPPSKQLEAVRTVREVGGNDVHLHLAGAGGSLEFIREVREHPRLIDSIDLSTHELAVINDQLQDKTWKQRSFRFPRGEDSTTIRSCYMFSGLMMLNYMLSPRCDDDLVEKKEVGSLANW